MYIIFFLVFIEIYTFNLISGYFTVWLTHEIHSAIISGNFIRCSKNISVTTTRLEWAACYGG